MYHLADHATEALGSISVTSVDTGKTYILINLTSKLFYCTELF